MGPYVFHGRYEGCFAQVLADRLDYGRLIVLDEVGELLEVVQPIIEREGRMRGEAGLEAIVCLRERISWYCAGESRQRREVWAARTWTGRTRLTSSIWERDVVSCAGTSMVIGRLSLGIGWPSCSNRCVKTNASRNGK